MGRCLRSDWLRRPASHVAQACLMLQEPDAHKQPRMAALMKKNLTGILINVTDSLFSELCTAQLAHDGDMGCQPCMPR